MTRTDTNVARRKLCSSRASQGQNNKRKYNKPSKAVRRRHFRRKGIDKPQEDEGLAQQALGIARAPIGSVRFGFCKNRYRTEFIGFGNHQYRNRSVITENRTDLPIKKTV